MARVNSRAPCNVRCSYIAKQLVSEVRAREQMCLEQIFDNVGAERMSSSSTQCLFRATGPATQNALYNMQ